MRLSLIISILFIPLVTQKLPAGLRESVLKSTTAGFVNAPVLIQYEDVCDRRFQGTLTQPSGQFLSDERYTRFVFSTDMTLEEKVGQLLMVHFNGERPNEDARDLIQKIGVGGIIYYNWANGLHSPKQVAELSAGLQALNRQSRPDIPLLIAADQEGGLVARLTQGFTVFPGNKALAMTGDVTLAEECAFAMGLELQAVGVNFNLSPVVDVNSNPRNPVIGIRSFGDSTDTVVPFSKSAMEGYRKAGIITSLKHFPGHGDVEVDSHLDLPVLYKSKEQLQTVELLPFSLLAAQADTIMTAHILVPAIDPTNCATLSKSILDILRHEMGFTGVIISDSLVMEGIRKNCPLIEEAAVQAFNAGCDLLLLGGKQLSGSHSLELTPKDIEKIHRALINAVKNGLISETRLNESVERILSLKKKYITTAPGEPLEVINSDEHQLLSKWIASLALKTKENKPVSLQQRSLAIFAPKIAKNNIEESSLLKLGKKADTLFFEGLNPTQKEIEQANKIAENCDVLIFCSYNAWKNEAQTKLVQSLSKHEKPLIVLLLRDPLDETLFPEADLILTLFGSTIPSLEAACEKLNTQSL